MLASGFRSRSGRRVTTVRQRRLIRLPHRSTQHRLRFIALPHKPITRSRHRSTSRLRLIIRRASISVLAATDGDMAIMADGGTTTATADGDITAGTTGDIMAAGAAMGMVATTNLDQEFESKNFRAGHRPALFV